MRKFLAQMSLAIVVFFSKTLTLLLCFVLSSEVICLLFRKF